MSQKNLYYSLIDKNGKILSVSDFKNAVGFKFYWGKKKVDELYFGDNWKVSEKRSTLDWYYEKTYIQLIKEEKTSQNLKKTNREIKKELPKLDPDKFYSFYIDSNGNLLDRNKIGKAKRFLLYYGYELVSVNDFNKISDSESSKRYQIKKEVNNARLEIFVKKLKEEEEIEEEKEFEYPEFYELKELKFNYRLLYRTYQSQQMTEAEGKPVFIKVKKAFANPKQPILFLSNEDGLIHYDLIKQRAKLALQEAYDYTKEYGTQSIDNRYILKFTYSFINDPNDIQPYMIIKEGNVKVLKAEFTPRLEQYLEGISTKRSTITRQSEFDYLFESFWEKFKRSMSNYTNAQRAFGYAIRTAMVESIVEKHY